MESQESSAAAQADQAAQARQRAEKAFVDHAVLTWGDLCRSEQLAAVKTLFKKELQLSAIVDAVEALTTENQRLGAEIGALQDSLEKATAESVRNAQRVQLLSVELTECNRELNQYKQQAASEEAGVDPPDDAPAKKMPLTDALEMMPESASQAELMQALSVVQEAYSGLEGDMGQIVQAAQNQIRTLNEQIQTLQKQATTHAQPKQPQQAQQAGALQDIQEDQVRTLDDALKVDYNLRNGDDVCAALKILQDEFGKLQDSKAKDSKANLTALQEDNKRLIRKCQELSGTVTLWETRYAEHLDAELKQLDHYRAKQHAENIQTIQSRNMQEAAKLVVLNEKEVLRYKTFWKDAAKEQQRLRGSVEDLQKQLQKKRDTAKHKAIQTNPPDRKLFKGCGVNTTPCSNTSTAMQTEVTDMQTEVTLTHTATQTDPKPHRWARLTLHAVVRQLRFAQAEVYVVRAANQDCQVACTRFEIDIDRMQQELDTVRSKSIDRAIRRKWARLTFRAVTLEGRLAIGRLYFLNLLRFEDRDDYRGLADDYDNLADDYDAVLAQRNATGEELRGTYQKLATLLQQQAYFLAQHTALAGAFQYQAQMAGQWADGQQICVSQHMQEVQERISAFDDSHAPGDAPP